MDPIDRKISGEDQDSFEIWSRNMLVTNPCSISFKSVKNQARWLPKD